MFPSCVKKAKRAEPTFEVCVLHHVSKKPKEQSRPLRFAHMPLASANLKGLAREKKEETQTLTNTKTNIRFNNNTDNKSIKKNV
jgi:hypothetical protein